MAASLTDRYGDEAIAGAKAALQVAGKTGCPETIHLWAEVCELLAAGTIVTIRL